MSFIVFITFAIANRAVDIPHVIRISFTHCNILHLFLLFLPIVFIVIGAILLLLLLLLLLWTSRSKSTD